MRFDFRQESISLCCDRSLSLGRIVPKEPRSATNRPSRGTGGCLDKRSLTALLRGNSLTKTALKIDIRIIEDESTGNFEQPARSTRCRAG
jgi:hypothetical protein